MRRMSRQLSHAETHGLSMTASLEACTSSVAAGKATDKTVTDTILFGALNSIGLSLAGIRDELRRLNESTCASQELRDEAAALGKEVLSSNRDLLSRLSDNEYREAREKAFAEMVNLSQELGLYDDASENRDASEASTTLTESNASNGRNASSETGETS